MRFRRKRTWTVSERDDGAALLSYHGIPIVVVRTGFPAYVAVIDREDGSERELIPKARAWASRDDPRGAA